MKTKSEVLAELHFPDAPFTFHDEHGAHDPCYVVMPGGCSLGLNHYNDAVTDIARAKFIIAACNAALAKLEPDRTPGFIRNPDPHAPPWERLKNLK